ncbi:MULTISPECIES: hypothetical protein [unclassified Bradyrhizobium]|uniref:hypothetical protein n=1 Tax=unclassified Bradyrhizobium TaxID=2631580 RepID=UPI003394879F
MIEGGPMGLSLTGRQVVTGNQHYLLWRLGLEDHFELAIAELTRRQLMAMGVDHEFWVVNWY